MSPWFERGLRSFGRNSATLLFGGAAAAALNLVAMAIVARTLEPLAFGQFALVITFIFVIDGIFSFQSWQALIKFGTDALRGDRPEEFCALVKAGILLDSGAAVMAVACGGVVAFVVGPLIGLQGAEPLAAAGCAVLLTRVTGVSTALLRMRGRFDLIATQQAAMSLIRVAFVAAVTLVLPTLGSFVLAWLAAEAIGNVIVIVYGWATLSLTERSCVALAPLSLLSPLRRSLFGFVGACSVHSTVKLSLRELDMLAVGALLGPVAAGMYRVVKQIAALAGKAMGPLYQAVYPDLATQFSLGNSAGFWRLVVIPGLGLGMLFLSGAIAFWLLGPHIIEAVVGIEYVPASTAATVYLLGTAVSAFTFGFQPAALALGAAGKSLSVLTVSVLIYAAAFVILATEHGLLGVSWAYVVFYVVWALLMSRMLLSVSRSIHWK